MTSRGLSASWRSDLREAAAFLTTVVPGRASPSPRSMTFFPVVGAVLGLCTGGVWRVVRSALPAAIAASLVSACDIAATGAIHLDGLADVADGMFAHVPTKKRLDIMSEPQVGTFGNLALSTSMIARNAAFSTLDPSAVLLASLWASSRALMVIGSRLLPYARLDGLATPFLDERRRADSALFVAVGSIAVASVVTLRTHGRRGMFGVLLGTAAGTALLRSARSRLGGFTGDVLGAAGVISETVALLVIAGGSS